jgi:hypothetical protein
MPTPGLCHKCGAEPITSGIWCNECNALMGRAHQPLTEARKQELGVYITPLEKQLAEPIPFVMDVEHWPELFRPARPQVSCYNRRVAPNPY